MLGWLSLVITNLAITNLAITRLKEQLVVVKQNEHIYLPFACDKNARLKSIKFTLKIAVTLFISFWQQIQYQ